MSSELVMDTSKHIFQIDKDILSFRINSDKINKAATLSSPTVISEDEFNIANLTDNYLALRIKTTKKLFYTVNPSYFILSPNSNQIVKFLFYYVPGNSVSSTGHKFRIEGFIITDSEQNEEPKDLFLNYSKNKIPVEGNTQKRFVQLIVDNESPTEEENNQNDLKISSASDYQVPQEKREESKPFQTVENIISGSEEKETKIINNENDNGNGNENINENNGNDNDNNNYISNNNDNNKKETLMDKITGSGDTGEKKNESEDVKKDNLSNNCNSDINYNLINNLNKDISYEMSENKEVMVPMANIILALVISILVGFYLTN